MDNIKCLLAFAVFISYAASVQSAEILQPDSSSTVDGRSTDLTVFCYKGRPKYIIHIWQSVIMHLDHKTDNFAYYEGNTEREVREEFDQHRSSWSLNLFSWKNKYFSLDPFNQSCIGIHSGEKYTVRLSLIRIDYSKILSLVVGIVLFVSAPKLSRNPFFYYLCGISLGICASFLVSVYFVSKLLPRKPFMYGVIVGGWTLGLYLLQILWDNVRAVVTLYRTYVVWYVIVTGCVSFVVCYRFGPVTNKKTQNIIQWSLQTLGLILVFHSSHFREAAMGQIVVLLIVYNFPKSWVSKSKTYWKRKFPPRIRLLSNDEYYEQGVKHTAKALEDLRAYCSSPNCNQWKTALKLQDVKRFASFIEGNSHLSDTEILDYESSVPDNYFTDDESNSEVTDDESELTEDEQ